MIIRCISNDPNQDSGLNRFTGKGSGSNLPLLPLTVNKDYVVYAIAQIGNVGAYLILDDDQTKGFDMIKTGDYEPIWYDKNLFKIVDDAIDPIWGKRRGTSWTRWRGETLSFPEFVANRGFYETVIDGDQNDVRIFSKYINATS